MFNDSIEANIKYANQNASSIEIEKAADEAGVNEFANSLPNKLHTIVGESGIKLSGGQRQRIAIARAILKNSLGTKGMRPAPSALSYPIIDPKYPTPKAKITIEPNIKAIKHLK